MFGEVFKICFFFCSVDRYFFFVGFKSVTIKKLSLFLFKRRSWMLFNGLVFGKFIGVVEGRLMVIIMRG